MTPMNEDRIDVFGDGRIVLYKRSGLKRPKWQARLKVPGSAGYKVVSTKTDSLKEAEFFARNLWDELRLHVKAGGSIKPKTFKELFNEWEAAVRTLGPTRQGGSWEPTIARVRAYALEFFGPKKLDQITQADFGEYWQWRKQRFKRKAPSNATLRRERTCLLPVFQFAVERGYLRHAPISDAPKATTERRPTFTLQEWRIITRNAREWIAEGKLKATWRDRYVAFQTFLILANTGLRVGELRGLRWGDLRTVQAGEGSRLVGNVRGKTGKREVVFQEGADGYVNRLRELRQSELGRDPPRDGLVVCHKDGSPIQSMKRAFASLLEFAEIPMERDGMARTPYSLRHFYATQRLSNETNPFLLAKQMGTSVEMLEKFYGQTVTSSLAIEITRRTVRGET